MFVKKCKGGRLKYGLMVLLDRLGHAQGGGLSPRCFQRRNEGWRYDARVEHLLRVCKTSASNCSTEKIEQMRSRLFGFLGLAGGF